MPERVRHLKRGTEYEVLTRHATLQAGEPAQEGSTLVVYRGDDGRTWVRPRYEFDDGRFEPIASTPPAPTPEAGSDLEARTLYFLRQFRQCTFGGDHGTPAVIYNDPSCRPGCWVDTESKALLEALSSPVPFSSPPPAEDLAGQGEPVAWCPTVSVGVLRGDNSDYVLLTVEPKGEPVRRMRLSIGGADVLLAELGDLLYGEPAPAPSRPADRGPMTVEEIAEALWLHDRPSDGADWAELVLNADRFPGVIGGKVQKYRSQARAVLALRDAPRDGGDGTQAARDVLAERRRQVEDENWTPEHDDAHSKGEMAYAAAAYAIHAGYLRRDRCDPRLPPAHWPWSVDWWKPTTARRDLVKAGALILAEIERLDRAAQGGDQ